MYNQAQLSQVKQSFIKQFNRFPTQEDIQTIWEFDHALFVESGESDFDSYFGTEEDYMHEEGLAVMIDDAINGEPEWLQHFNKLSIR